MNVCRKCGEMFSGMRYDNARDVLVITCPRCGFSWNTDPLDKLKYLKRKIETEAKNE